MTRIIEKDVLTKVSIPTCTMEPCTVTYKVYRRVPICVPITDPCSPIHSYLMP